MSVLETMQSPTYWVSPIVVTDYFPFSETIPRPAFPNKEKRGEKKITPKMEKSRSRQCAERVAAVGVVASARKHDMKALRVL
jgi:hypothetical protein